MQPPPVASGIANLSAEGVAWASRNLGQAIAAASGEAPAVGQAHAVAAAAPRNEKYCSGGHRMVLPRSRMADFRPRWPDQARAIIWVREIVPIWIWPEWAT